MKQQPSKLVNGALLSGTLRTFQKAACDDQIVTLRCPTGTCISIELAHYGNTAGPAAAALCRHHTDQSNQTCLWPNALQTVVEACQNKQQCKFHTSPKTFGGDPCPGVHKYVEVAYKCRPYEFRSKVACQNDALQLKCNPPTRIAIYSASFGRTEYESARCPQPQGVREETCLVSYATETVIQICHGKAHCSLSADTATFGNPCHKDSRMYLKLVFTCVPRRVLREPYDNRLEVDNVDGDIIDDPDYDIDYGTIGDTVIYRDRGSDSSYSPSPKLSAPNISGNTSLLQPPPSHVSPSPPQNERSSKGKLLTLLSLSSSHLSQNQSQPPKNLNASATTDRLHHRHHITSHRVPKDMRVTDQDQEQKSLQQKHQRHMSESSDVELTSSDILPSQSIVKSESSNELQQINCTLTIYTDTRTKFIGFISDWISTYNFLSQNQEKLILYLILSVSGGLLSILTLVIGRLLWQRRTTHQRAKYHASAATTTLPNGFADDISEIDADIGLTTVNTPPVTMIIPSQMPSHHSHSHSHSPSEVVRYGGGDSNAPRSLSRSGNSQYYYG
ncbi:uncharacterized protein LOC142327916 isoform X1 [Lycorma delicatula]|uniref:uncharacterized protein LOC142327916 isoform X1 n=1 Tax=Lycorma delicatula TaxID=130591 RepID=UPI003F51A5D4